MKHFKKLKPTLQLALLALAFLLPGAAWAQYAPGNVQVISGPSQTLLTWDGIDLADYYTIARSTTSGGPYTTIAGYVTTESYTDTDVTNGVEYFYILTAVYPEIYFPNKYSAPEAAGIPLSSGSNYSFVNRWSEMALANSNGAAVQQTYTSAGNQLWKVVAITGGYFAIFNGSADATLTGATPSSQLTVSPYNFNTNQFWYFQVTNGAELIVHNASTGQVLDDFGNSLASGSPVGQWVPDGGTNQEWAVAQPGPPSLVSVSLTNDGLPAQFTFSGQINPNGLPTAVICSVGASANYSVSVTNMIPAASALVSYSYTVPYAYDGSTIHGQVTVQNAAGANSSGDLTFAVGPPLVQTEGILPASVSQSAVSAQINPNNLPTTVVMQFGTNTAYGQAVTNMLAATNGYQLVTDTFNNPAPLGATLHAFITASNAGGATTSGDFTFVFQPPQIQSVAVAGDGQFTKAYVSAQINPNGSPTTVIIQLGTNTAYGITITNQALSSSVTNGFQSLASTIDYPDLNVTTTLHAFITASNAAGSVTSGDFTCSSLLFQNVYGSSFTWVNPLTGSAAWADIDNDGWLDLAVEGLNSLPSLSASGSIFYNPGTNQLYHTPWTEKKALVSGIRSAIGVGDLDNDNHPDFLFACGPFLPGFYPSDFGITDEGLWDSLSIIQYGSDEQEYAQTNSTVINGLEVIDASVAMADFAHTGREGALVSGFVGTGATTMEGLGPISMLYQNNDFSGRSSGVYENIGPISTLEPVNTSVPAAISVDPSAFSSGQTVLVAGDFDNDGFPDLFVLNFLSDDPYRPAAGFFHGDGNGTFTMTTNTFFLYPTLPALQFSYVETASCVLADMNGDGYLDMVLSYGNQLLTNDFGIVSGTTVGVWLNDGHGNLTNSSIALPQLGLANLAVGDIFNHGRNDILMVGYANQNYGEYLNGAPPAPPMETVALRNDRNGVFTPVVLGSFGSIGETGHGLQLADYDNDGRLDFVMTGDDNPAAAGSGTSPFLADTRIFRNVMNIPSNAPPAAPTNLSTTVGDGTVTFHWGNAADDITPANLLTYNVRVGTNSLGTQTVSPLANVTNGWRKIVAPGNCAHATNMLYRFPPGTYYWSVQAVDGGFKGGAWAPEQTFTITNAEQPVLTLGNANNSIPPFLASELSEPDYEEAEALLGASTTGNNITSTTLNLSWPVRFQGCSVQQAASLEGPWTSLTNIGTLNGQWSVLVTNNSEAAFFRLVK